MQHNGKTRQNALIYTLGSILILVLGLLMTRDIMQYMDVLLSDETKYLAGGLNFFDRIPKAWGPSYSLWYKFLSFFQGDPLSLHYFNYKVLAIGVSIMLFIALVRLRVHALIAFLVGAGFLVGDLNIVSWPRISHFAAFLILIAVTISTFLKPVFLKLLLFTFTAVLLSYARPELGLSFTALAGVTGLWVLYKRFRLRKAEYLITVVFVAVVGVAFLKAGVPMYSGGKSQPNIESGKFPRQLTAYGQHFYLNYLESNNKSLDTLLYWDEAFADFYEIEPSLLSTLKSNIPITARHIGFNIKNYLTRSFDYSSGAIYAGKILRLPVWLKLILTVLFVGLLIGFRRRQYWEQIEEHHRDFKWEYLGIFLLSFPPMISSVLIYPRDHYLMLQVPFLFLVASLLLLIHIKPRLDTKAVLGSIVGIAILFGLLMPHGSRFEHFTVWQNREGPVNLSAIQTINELGIEEDYVIVLNEGTIDTYLDNKGVQSFVPYGMLDGRSFDVILEEESIRMVYVSSMMLNDPGLVRDPSWKIFLEDPEAEQFRRVETGSEYGYLLVHESLL